VKKRDPKGYYAALNISPDAGQQEIRLAYTFLKQAFKDGKRTLNIGLIQEAYETLSDSEQRDLYDRAGSPRPDGKSRLHSVPLLVTLLLIFLGVLAFAVGPVIKAHFTTFDAGAELYWKRTGKPVGVILAYDPAHEFETGAATPAYQVEIRSGEEPVWFSAWDLNRNCERR
jgi:hypothetical protein